MADRIAAPVGETTCHSTSRVVVSVQFTTTTAGLLTALLTVFDTLTEYCPELVAPAFGMTSLGELAPEMIWPSFIH